MNTSRQMAVAVVGAALGLGIMEAQSARAVTFTGPNTYNLTFSDYDDRTVGTGQFSFDREPFVGTLGLTSDGAIRPVNPNNPGAGIVDTLSIDASEDLHPLTSFSARIGDLSWDLSDGRYSTYANPDSPNGELQFIRPSQGSAIPTESYPAFGAENLEEVQTSLRPLESGLSFGEPDLEFSSTDVASSSWDFYIEPTSEQPGGRLQISNLGYFSRYEIPPGGGLEREWTSGTWLPQAAPESPTAQPIAVPTQPTPESPTAQPIAVSTQPTPESPTAQPIAVSTQPVPEPSTIASTLLAGSAFSVWKLKKRKAGLNREKESIT